MIDYAKVKLGDKVKVVGAGAPGYAELGDELTITAVQRNRVDTVNAKGLPAYFALTCGAARLEPCDARHQTPEAASGDHPGVDRADVARHDEVTE